MRRIKHAFKKLISATLVLAISMALCVPAFAADKHSENKDTLVSSAMELVNKLEPYVQYKDGKAILGHVDAKKLGITQQELKDVRKGMEMVSVKKSDGRENSDIHTDVSYDTNDYGLYIRLTPNDIKAGIVAGVIAGGIIALGGIFTKSIAAQAAGVIVDVVTNITWVYADMLPTTIYIPNESLASGYGPMYIYNSVHSVRTLYMP
jgi:hypothetical protein